MPRVQSAKRHTEQRKIPVNNFMVNDSLNKTNFENNSNQQESSFNMNILHRNSYQLGQGGASQQNLHKQKLYIDKLQMQQKLNETQKNSTLQKTEIHKLEKKINLLHKELLKTQKQSSAQSAVKGYWQQQKPNEVIQSTDKISQMKEKISVKKKELEYQESQLQQIQKKMKFSDIKEMEQSKKIKQNQCGELKDRIERLFVRQEINNFIESGQIEEIDNIFRQQQNDVLQFQKELKKQNELQQEENYRLKESIKGHKFEQINLKQEIKYASDKIKRLEKAKEQIESEIQQLEIQEQQREIKKKSVAILTNKDIQEESLKNQIRTIEEEMNQKNLEMQKQKQENDEEVLRIEKNYEYELKEQEQLEQQLQQLQNLNLELEQNINNTPSLRSIVLQNKQIFKEIENTSGSQKKQFLKIQNSNRRYSLSNYNNFNNKNTNSVDSNNPTSIKKSVTQQDDYYEIQRKRARSGDPRQRPNSERQDIIEKNAELEESPIKSRQKQIKNRQQINEDFKQRIQEFKENQQSFNRLRDNSQKSSTQIQQQQPIDKERLQSAIKNINDPDLKPIQENLLRLNKIEEIQIEGEKLISEYLEVQNSRIYILDKKIIYRFEQLGSKENPIFQKIEYNKEAGIFGYAIKAQNLITVNQTHNDSYFNPKVDIDTQLPLITYPIYAFSNNRQNSLIVGAIQCISPQRIGNVYNSQRISQGTLQKFHNIGDVIANQLQFFKLKEKA